MQKRLFGQNECSVFCSGERGTLVQRIADAIETKLTSPEYRKRGSAQSVNHVRELVLGQEMTAMRASIPAQAEYLLAGPVEDIDRGNTQNLAKVSRCGGIANNGRYRRVDLGQHPPHAGFVGRDQLFNPVDGDDADPVRPVRLDIVGELPELGGAGGSRLTKVSMKRTFAA